jgi:hypothetical protein
VEAVVGAADVDAEGRLAVGLGPDHAIATSSREEQLQELTDELAADELEGIGTSTRRRRR